MTYRILFDYGAYEGMKFIDGKFATVDGAVQAALKECSVVPFLIVQVIDWEARPRTQCIAETADE